METLERTALSNSLAIRMYRQNIRQWHIYGIVHLHKGETPFRLGTLKLYKRDELLAEVPQSVLINADSPVATYRFTVDSFEAGTPFFIEVEACGENGNDTSGLVFTNKVTQ